MTVSGNIVQLASEFENIARGIRIALCSTLGNDLGAKLYEEVVESAKMSEEERKEMIDKKLEEAKNTHPIALKMSEHLAKDLLRDLLGWGNSDPDGSVEEEVHESN